MAVGCRWLGGEEVGAHLDVLVHMFHHIFHLIEGGEPRQVYNKQVTPVSPGFFFKMGFKGSLSFLFSKHTFLGCSPQCLLLD